MSNPNPTKKPALRTSGAASDRGADVATRAAAADGFVSEAGKAPAPVEVEWRPITLRVAADLEEKLRLVAFQRRSSVAKVARELLEEAIRQKL